jgi:hypothetical protein
MKRHFGVFRDYASVTQPQATITRTHVTINCLFELPKGSISKINPSPIRFERMRPKMTAVSLAGCIWPCFPHYSVEVRDLFRFQSRLTGSK